MKAILVTFISLTIMWFVASGVNAGQTWNVPMDVPTIPAAMDSAATGDTILVAPGVHYLQELTVKNGVVLTSIGGPLVTEISPVDMPLNFGAFHCYGLDAYTEISGFFIHGYYEGLWGHCEDYRSATISIRNSLNVVIRNNIIEATGWGLKIGADPPFASQATVANNTLYVKSPGLSSSIALEISNPECSHGFVITQVNNNIIWGRARLSGILTASCNDYYAPVDIPTGDTGSFSLDPQFCADLPGAQQWSINDSSPCAPNHSGGCELIGAMGVLCGTVPTQPTTWGEIKKILEGN